MDNLFSKIIKIANYLDQKGLYEESDFLENKLIKIAVAPPRPTMPPVRPSWTPGTARPIPPGTAPIPPARPPAPRPPGPITPTPKPPIIVPPPAPKLRAQKLFQDFHNVFLPCSAQFIQSHDDNMSSKHHCRSYNEELSRNSMDKYHKESNMTQVLNLD